MINKELKKKIKDLEPYLKSGKLINGNSIIDLYNEFKGPDPRTGRKVGYTSCGSCLRRYLTEMVNAVKREEQEQKEKMKKVREAKKQKEIEEKQKQAEASADCGTSSN